MILVFFYENSGKMLKTNSPLDGVEHFPEILDPPLRYIFTLGKHAHAKYSDFYRCKK